MISGRASLCVGLFALAACGNTDVATDAHTWTKSDSARMSAVLAPLVANHEFMGAVAFARNGEIVHAEGAGMADVASGRLFTPHTPADGGSLAKTFTAAALWSLVQAGRVVIDTPVTTYIADYPHAATTVRQLIAHSNGLTPDYAQFDAYFGPNDLRTTEALLAAVKRNMPQPRFALGTRFEYSNLGYDAAALVVERVTGQPIARVFREQFFAPLGMDSSFARPGHFADWVGARTLGHRWSDSGWVVVDVFDNEAFIGASNVYFSAIDLARWGQAQAERRALPTAVDQLGSARPIIDGQRSPINGLSWYCDDAGDRCSYTGAINAFHSLVYWDRVRGEAVAMISNSNLAPWTMATLHRDLVAVLEGREPRGGARPSFENVQSKSRGASAGRYVAPGMDTIHVSDTPDDLRLRVGKGLEFEVFQVRRDAFYVPGLDYVIGFTLEGERPRLHVRSISADFSATRVPKS